MVECSKLLGPGGQALVTLKLPHPEKTWRPATRRALEVLRPGYRVPRLRQLYYNRNEVTV